MDWEGGVTGQIGENKEITGGEQEDRKLERTGSGNKAGGADL